VEFVVVRNGFTVPREKHDSADQHNCGRDDNTGAQKLTEHFIQFLVGAG
jgi:hypothetical protein